MNKLGLAPPTNFQTNRLTISAAEIKDSRDLFEHYFSNDFIATFLQRKTHVSQLITERVIREWGHDSWLDGNRFAWTIRDSNSNRLMGLFLIQIDKLEAELHFGVVPEQWGHGIAAEAGLAVIRWFIENTDIARIWAICDTENNASLRVLSKFGLQRKILLRKHMKSPLHNSLRDCWLYEWSR